MTKRILRTLTAGAKLLSVGLALAAVLIGAEYVRAAGSHHEVDSAVEEISPTDLVAAELDPAFVQKLAERSRGPYERSHRAIAQR